MYRLHTFKALISLCVLSALALLNPQVLAFCGFYVAKADTNLFNEASKVVIARHDNKTVITMANDYQGTLKEFAIVIPVPTVVTRKQIHVTENKIIDHLDAYTAPRLVEYFDPDPCRRYRIMYDMASRSMPVGASAGFKKSPKKAYGVTIEASYTVGEYDILILSAKESHGLQRWLMDSGYKVPPKAVPILESYLKQGTKFFVAKVNLKEQAKLGQTFLRPLQIAFESPKFMLPIRLGTVNAKGPQELFVFFLTQKGRVESTNYRTVKAPSGMDIPVFVKDDFGKFYTDMFQQQVKKESMRTLFLEYAWDMAWCDPCAADPLSQKELRELGVFWLRDGKITPTNRRQRSVFIPPNRAPNVFVTRLHLRYDASHFPEDLMFQETSDRSNFQGRYVLRHPWTGRTACSQATVYKETLPKRFEKEAETLANLTGWSLPDIYAKMNFNGDTSPNPPRPWFEWLWSK